MLCWQKPISKSAFHTIPVRYEDRELLGIHWRQQYYVDCCLPFGLRSAPFIFNRYAEALQWILRHNYQIADIIHNLDDFLIAGKPSSPDCQRALTTMLEVCGRLGFPIAGEKLEGPTMVIIFLGILLDATKMELRLPQDKVEALISSASGMASYHSQPQSSLCATLLHTSVTSVNTLLSGYT